MTYVPGGEFNIVLATNPTQQGLKLLQGVLSGVQITLSSRLIQHNKD